MAFQFGLLAHLTFIDYSWDLMEPVTYFVTYGTQIIAMMYFINTKTVITFNSFVYQIRSIQTKISKSIFTQVHLERGLQI